MVKEKKRKDLIMNSYINCNDGGVAFMSLCNANKSILISGSLTSANYWNLPSSFCVLNILEDDYGIIPFWEYLKTYGVNYDYKLECELKAVVCLIIRYV